jgi:hypothetical protein
MSIFLDYRYRKFGGKVQGVPGNIKPKNKLWLIVYQGRDFSTEIKAVWAENYNEALMLYGKDPKMFKHTIAQIGGNIYPPPNLPLEAGIHFPTEEGKSA